MIHENTRKVARWQKIISSEEKLRSSDAFLFAKEQAGNAAEMTSRGRLLQAVDFL